MTHFVNQGVPQSVRRVDHLARQLYLAQPLLLVKAIAAEVRSSCFSNFALDADPSRFGQPRVPHQLHALGEDIVKRFVIKQSKQSNEKLIPVPFKTLDILDSFWVTPEIRINNQFNFIFFILVGIPEVWFFQ